MDQGHNHQDGAGNEEDRPQGGINFIPFMLMALTFNFYLSYYLKPSSVANNSTNITYPAAQNITESVSQNTTLSTGDIPNLLLKPAWQSGYNFNLFVFLDTNPDFTPNNFDKLIWEQRSLSFDWNPNNERSDNITITLTPEMQNNNTLYAHIYFISQFYEYYNIILPDNNIIYYKYNLTKYIMSPLQENKNLINNTQGYENYNRTPGETYNYFKPILNIDLVHSFETINPHQLPMQLGKVYRKTPIGDYYYPVVFINEINVMQSSFIPLNETINNVTLQLYYNTYSWMKFQMQQQIQTVFNYQVQFGIAAEEDFELMKSVLYETNHYLLVLTIIVSTLHMVFEFLAFKNDILFWKNANSYEGLSIRTLFLNIFSQLTIILYLMDNETSFMIIASSFVGIGIEIWKIRKVLRFKIYYWNNIPLLKFRDRAIHSKTKEYDQQAMKYLMRLVYPLIICYSLYSLYYNTYKSWYSWIISSLTSFVYTFGFIMMTPQLFINYKFKSVAHLPWRALTYKSLNTFIDDLFSFVIKMPMMHRIACLRDDVIFIIYIYQRWIYPVDKKRRNEYGLTGEEEEKLAILRKAGVKNITLDDLSRPYESLVDDDAKNKKSDDAQEDIDTLVEEEKENIKNRKNRTTKKDKNNNNNSSHTISEYKHRDKYEKLLIEDSEY